MTMQRFQFQTVDVFTETRFGGNQLAVVLNAEALSADQMQTIAAEFNLSETAFILKPEDPAHSARVRIFHRTAELPFAGHPSVGSAFVLAGLPQFQSADRLTLEVPAGLVNVSIRQRDASRSWSATIGAPQPLQLGPELPVATVAACIGLREDEIVTLHHKPREMSMGNTYYAVEVTSEGLTSATPDIAAFRQAVRDFPVLARRFSLHVYAREKDHVRARMFSPLAGTFEDPATGSANVALAGLLLSLTQDERLDTTVVQGVEMGRPSKLDVSARRTPNGIEATVGGSCVAVMSGELLV